MSVRRTREIYEWREPRVAWAREEAQYEKNGFFYNLISYPDRLALQQFSFLGSMPHNIDAETEFQCFPKCFPCLPAHATFVADASETQNMFLNFFRNILLPQQMLRTCANRETFWEAMFPQQLMFSRLQGP